MTEEQGYQGWTNYETFSIALVIDNNRDQLECWRETGRTIRAEVETDEDAALELADEMKEHFDEGNPLVEMENAEIYDTLLQAALSRVNWTELARHYLKPQD